MNLSQDMFLVCIFGGVFLGCGTGLIIKATCHFGRNRHHRHAADALHADALFAGHPARRLVYRRLRYGRFGRLAFAALLANHYLCVVADHRLHHRRPQLRQAAFHHIRPSGRNPGIHPRQDGPGRNLYQVHRHVYRSAARHDLSGGEPQRGVDAPEHDSPRSIRRRSS